MSDRTITTERMHKLRVWAAIVEQGSMTAAAKSIDVSRSVVSAHLKQLEADLGVRLLERTTRTMRVTAIGTEVYRQARAMIDAAQGAMEAVESHLGAVRGLLRVAIPIDLGATVLVPVLEQLRGQYPELRVEALVGDAPIDLHRDAVDVAVRLGVPHESGAILKRLARTEEIFVASPEFADTYQLDDVLHLMTAPRLAHPEVEDARPTLLGPNHEELELHLPAPVLMVGSSFLLRSLAVQGLGVAVMPEIIARKELERGELVRVAGSWVRRRVEVYAITASRVTSPSVRAFLDGVAAQIG